LALVRCYYDYYRILSLFVIPKEGKAEEPSENSVKPIGYLEPYKIVFKNPQSWLCGVISGLLFAPTTIFAMTWAVAFFQKIKVLFFMKQQLPVLWLLSGGFLAVRY
jgi:hypothetical protein